MKDDNASFDVDLENAVLDSLDEHQKKSKKTKRVPSTLPIFPLARRPFFPGMAAPLLIEPGPFLEVLKTISKTENRYIGLLLTKNENTNIYEASFDDLNKVGVLAKILRIIPMDQGGVQVILNMEKRMIVEKPMASKKCLRAKVSFHEDKRSITKELKAYAISVISTIKELLKLNPLFKEELQIFLGHSEFTEPGKLSDFAVALTTATREELQDLLETFDVQERIEKALIILKKELDLTLLQSNIHQQIDASISKSQKDFFLKEQLKTIKKELGIERDEKSLDRDKFEERLKQRTVPTEVMEVIDDEMEKLNALDLQSAEYAISRGYLDWLTSVPWGLFSQECLDLKKASATLEEDHYGLEDIKKRILEFIGVGKLSGGVKGSIICLVGPPGVGKTSIGKSIAKALNREFYRFSVGGMRDEAEIKGHRRTYIGAMPGKLIQALKTCKTMNPVIMLDEVDKMGNSYHGDPASALLEVLDPEQNVGFLDHYLDVPCNLSNVLFIVTANVLESIPHALRDRMEVLRLSGYIMQEKLAIAQKYLIPKNRKQMSLLAKQIHFSKEALRGIVNGYAREAGVRGLENLIKKVMRKVAVKIVEEQEKKKRKKRKDTSTKQYRITARNLTDWLKNPLFTTDRYYETTPVGVCTGLAWTALGGATLYIETIKVPAEKTGMRLTGQAGDVMKESSQIAWSYLHSALHEYAPEYTFFEKTEVHIHIPEGATPKDGPSAGITMVTALLSLLTNTPIKENLGMTGELTLTGRVLPIGGLKEKLIAARRADLTELIFPIENRRDYDELPDYLKEGLTIHFVENYKEVFPIAFPAKSRTKEEG